MITNIIATDNSSDMLIPKAFLKKSGLGPKAMVETKRGEIRIVFAARSNTHDKDAILSESVLAADWTRPEEDKAWINLK